MLRRNVLIFQTGGLGDFVLTWPFAVALGRIYPQSRIIYVTHSQKGDLAKRVLRLEATDIEAGWHGLFAESGKLPPPAMSLLECAHAVYSFLPASEAWHDNVDRLNPRARRIEIDSRISGDYTGHVTDRMLESLKDHPPERAAMEQILKSVNDRGIGFKSAGGGDVVIHPGSGSPAKCWPLDRFLELADCLEETGKSVRFVIGEVEQDRWSAQDLDRLKSAGRLVSCNTYLELLNEISTARLFIGNDSGPAHLAGIIGVPTIAVFGSTNPKQWKPLGPRVTIVQGSSLQDLKVNDILKAATGA